MQIDIKLDVKNLKEIKQSLLELIEGFKYIIKEPFVKDENGLREIEIENGSIHIFPPLQFKKSRLKLKKDLDQEIMHLQKFLNVEINKKTFINDLGIDSLDMLDIMFDLEEKFKVQIPNDHSFETVKDIINYIYENGENNEENSM